MGDGNGNDNDSGGGITIHPTPYATSGGGTESAIERARRDANTNRGITGANADTDSRNSESGERKDGRETNGNEFSTDRPAISTISNSSDAKSGRGNSGGEFGDNVVRLRRGRHPIPCDRGAGGQSCARCKEKALAAESNTRNISIDNPGIVNPFDFIKELSNLDGDFAKGLAMFWGLIYQIPVMMQWGAHWALNESEGKALSAATLKVLKAVPDKQREAVMQMMDKYMPISIFAGTIAATTYPRYLTTKMLVSQIAEQKERGNVSPINRQNDGTGTTYPANSAVRFIDDNP